LDLSGASAFNGRMDMLKTLKSSTITKKADLLPIPTVGEILLEEFLKPLALSQNALARAVDVPPRRINEIVLGKRSVTADTDLRLTRYFRMSAGFFAPANGT
jgi:antitoxin HigA-1